MLLIGILTLILLSSFTHYTKTEIKQLLLLSILILLYTIIIQYNIYDTILLGTAIDLYNNILLLTNYNIIIGFLLLIIGIVYLSIVIYYIDYNENVKYYKEFPAIVLINIFSIILFICSTNMILIFVSIELQSYTLYVLTTIYTIPNASISKHSDSRSTSYVRLGLTYFLLGSLASIIILLGLTILYGYTDTINIIDMAYYLNSIWYTDTINTNIIILGLLLVIFGLLFKVGVVPIHNWLIEIYVNTPTIITLWISLVSKISIFTFLYTLLYTLSYIYDDLFTIINLYNIIGILCMIIGSLGGLSQISIKRILAYSGLANIGYILFSLLANNHYTLLAYIFNIIQYSLTHINIFIIVLVYIIYYMRWISIQRYNNTTIQMNNNILNSLNIYEIISLITCNPTLTVCMIISLASLMGIPPLSGFYGKLLLLESGLLSGFWYSALILILTSVITAFYYSYIMAITTFKQINLSSYNTYLNSSYSFKSYNNNISTNGNIEINIVLAYIISILTILILLPQLILDVYINGVLILEYYLYMY